MKRCYCWNHVPCSDETKIMVLGIKRRMAIMKNCKKWWRFCYIVGFLFHQRLWTHCQSTRHHRLHEIQYHFILTKIFGCLCQETKIKSSLDLSREHWSKAYVQINTKMLDWPQIQALAMAISIPWSEPHWKKRVHESFHQTIDFNLTLFSNCKNCRRHCNWY